MTQNPQPQLQPLTAKEKKVLEFIELYMLDRGVSPSFQEIKDHFGFASFNSVQRYLKQLQSKDYIQLPENNRKRGIRILCSAQAMQDSLGLMKSKQVTTPKVMSSEKEAFSGSPILKESLSLPLLGRVAAGQPLEAFDHDEFVDVPDSFIRNASKSFALRVEGQSMIDDGICDGDVILVQEQKDASNGEIVVAVVDDEATVKHFYLHSATSQIELRPANEQMESFWYSPEQVQIRGVVVGLLRKY